MAGERKGTSPWIYVGCGCAALVGLAVLAVVGAGFFGFSKFKGYVQEMSDPVARDARARELLGTEQLPEGYHARLFFRIPWVFNTVILTDGEQLPAFQSENDPNLEDFAALDAASLGGHVFIYLRLLRYDGHTDLDGIFSGRHENVELDLDSRFESTAVLGQGSFTLEPAEVSYTAHQGEVVTNEGERFPGIFSEMRIHCPSETGARLAVWYERTDEAEAAPGEAPAEVEASASATPVEQPPGGAPLAGSPADEAALRAFLGHFDFCAV